MTTVAAPAPAPAEAPKQAPTEPVSKEDEVLAQWERAKAKVAEKEQSEPAKAPAQKPKAEAAKSDDSEPESPPAPDDDAESAAPAKSPRALLEEGDIEAALKAAFGDDIDPAKLNINSKSFADFNKYVKNKREKLARERTELSAYEQKLEQAAARASQRFEPLVQAQKLLKDGDFEGFVKIISDGELTADEFNRKLLHSKFGKNPEVEQLKRQLREKEEREQREREEYAARQAEQERAQQTRAYLQQISGELAESEHPGLVAAAQEPLFVQRVFAIQQQHWDERTQTTLPLQQAAQMAFEELQGVHNKYARLFGATGAHNPGSVQGGKTPARPNAKAFTTLRTSEAAEASPPGHRLSDDELLAKYERLMREAG